MSVKMTEITPQIPSGVAKISVEVGDVVADISFDAELELIEALPAESDPGSLDFTQVGQILRKMMPLDEPIQTGAAQPPSIDVELPVAKAAIAEASQDQTRQILVAESKMVAPIASTTEVDDEPQPADVIPSIPTSNVQISNPLLISTVPESPSSQVMRLLTKPRNNLQPAENLGGVISTRNLDPRHTFTEPQSNAPQGGTPDSPDIVSRISSKSKPTTVADVHRDFSGFGVGISDKPHVQRPLPSAVSAVAANATQPQTAETKVISQISTVISNTSKDTVEIRLDPPELGRVIISITQSDSGLSATITSEKPEVADLLRRHAELLSRELSKSGFHEASLEFSHRDQQQDQPTFEGDGNRLSSASTEQAEASSTIEMILQSQSGSLDIRL